MGIMGGLGAALGWGIADFLTRDAAQIEGCLKTLPYEVWSPSRFDIDCFDLGLAFWCGDRPIGLHVDTGARHPYPAKAFLTLLLESLR